MAPPKDWARFSMKLQLDDSEYSEYTYIKIPAPL
jgi:hypothetical protein